MNYEAMREVRRRADAYLLLAQQLSPPFGTIAVGGEHFDNQLKGDALSAFLAELGRTSNPLAACESAKQIAKEMICSWNNSRKQDWQLHRWQGAADSILESACNLCL